MSKITDLEAELGTARQRYNRAAETFNQEVVQFPSSFVASHSGLREMPYYQADAAAKKAPVLLTE